MSEMKSIDDATLSGKIKTYIVDPGTGEKFRCFYQDPTDEQRRRLQELEEADGEEAGDDLQELVVDELFLSDKITSDSGLAQKQAVITGLFRALGANDAIDDAQELMADLQEQGNQ